MTQDKTPMPALQALLHAEPDLVDRIFDYILSNKPQYYLGQPQEQIEKDKDAVRAEFRGDQCYITDRYTARQKTVYQILSMFNGRNATEVARRLQISRATVYRVLKQPGIGLRK